MNIRLIIFFAFFPSILFCQKKNNKAQKKFKVVGYYFLNAAVRDTTHADSSYLFLDKITHLNIAFINPDSAGNFNTQLPLDTLIKKAHNKNVKVLASIAGGGSHFYYSNLLKDENRKAFVASLITMMERYRFDGIDVDLEGSDIDSNYEKFVTQLGSEIRRKRKLMTAAIATAYKDRLTDKALKQFDFVNIMSYDRKGPWRPNDPGNHSPYSMAVEDLQYWHKERKISKNKLVLGLPFYGYAFGPAGSAPLSMTYRKIVEEFPVSETPDTLYLPSEMIMYYNDIQTIKNKTRLAKRNAGGVMIWQLLGDARGDKSLLNAIDKIRKD